MKRKQAKGLRIQGMSEKMGIPNQDKQYITQAVVNSYFREAPALTKPTEELKCTKKIKLKRELPQVWKFAL